MYRQQRQRKHPAATAAAVTTKPRRQQLDCNTAGVLTCLRAVDVHLFGEAVPLQRCGDMRLRGFVVPLEALEWRNRVWEVALTYFMVGTLPHAPGDVGATPVALAISFSALFASLLSTPGPPLHSLRSFISPSCFDIEILSYDEICPARSLQNSVFCSFFSPFLKCFF